MQYLNRAMHEKGYQESSVDKYSTTTQLCRSHQSSSSCDLQSTTQLSTKLKMERNHLPKAAKEPKNYGSTIAKIHEHCNNFVFPKSGDSSLQTGINRTLQRRQAQRYQSCSKRRRKTTTTTEIGFRLTVPIEGYRG
ncbi:hypothetical protein F511_35630 [Dorcoceras hygrometricum]|uniref:Uncharacterized protein n=1 Tax=Dorcoceras hygrometricum TaxID=472368 RepID=A0A2Z7CRI2_9LAMI|nr:hypothetical protein F511_35630 [Dorcoceras hygrometricum]